MLILLRNILIRANYSGILVVFFLVPFWYRVPQTPHFITDLYVTRFVIFQLMLICVVLWVFSACRGLVALMRDRNRALALLFLLLLGLWMYISSSWAFMRSSHPELAANASLQFMVVGLFLTVCASMNVSPRHIVIVLAIGCGLHAIIAIWQVILQQSIGGIFQSLGEFTLGLNMRGVSYVSSGDQLWLRPYGLLPHPNILAGFLGVGLFALLGVLIRSKRRLLLLPILIIGLLAFFLTFSRASWLGVMVGGFVFTTYLIKYRLLDRRILIVFGVIIATGLIFLLIFFPFVAARAGVGRVPLEQHSLGERTILNNTALTVIDKNFVFGVGAGNFPWRASYLLYEQNIPMRGDNVHHVMLSIWAENGIVGFILANGALILGVEAVLRRLRSGREDRLERVCLLAGIVMFLVIIFFDHYPATLIQFQLLWWGILIITSVPSYSVSPHHMLESD